MPTLDTATMEKPVESLVWDFASRNLYITMLLYNSQACNIAQHVFKQLLHK